MFEITEKVTGKSWTVKHWSHVIDILDYLTDDMEEKINCDSWCELASYDEVYDGSTFTIECYERTWCPDEWR